LNTLDDNILIIPVNDNSGYFFQRFSLHVLAEK
jgi:hypothetical protein